MPVGSKQGIAGLTVRTKSPILRLAVPFTFPGMFAKIRKQEHDVELSTDSTVSSGMVMATLPMVDIGILTIRDDEFRAVLDAFPDGHSIHRGRRREYTLRSADAGSGRLYQLALLRQIEQGNGEAQEAAGRQGSSPFTAERAPLARRVETTHC